MTCYEQYTTATNIMNILYRPIHTTEDQIILQNDLLTLERWASVWDMQFNPLNVTFCQQKEMGTSLYTSTHYVGKYYSR